MKWISVSSKLVLDQRENDDFDIKQTLQIISHTILLTESNETWTGRELF